MNLLKIAGQGAAYRVGEVGYISRVIDYIFKIQ
jgi:hypothetical protein